MNGLLDFTILVQETRERGRDTRLTVGGCTGFHELGEDMRLGVVSSGRDLGDRDYWAT